MKKDYSKSVSIHCSTCGETSFEFEDENGPVHCVSCNRVFMREELIRENGARVASDVEGMKSEIVTDIRKDLKKMFKKFK